MLVWGVIALIPTPQQHSDELAATAESIKSEANINERLNLAADQAMAEFNHFHAAIMSKQGVETSSKARTMPVTEMPGEDRVPSTATEQLMAIRESIWSLYDGIQNRTYESAAAVENEIEQIKNELSAYAENISEAERQFTSDLSAELDLIAAEYEQNADRAARMVEESLSRFNDNLQIHEYRERLSELRDEIAAGTEREIDEVVADFRELESDIEMFASSAATTTRATLDEFRAELSEVVTEIEEGGENIVESLDALIESLAEQIS